MEEKKIKAYKGFKTNMTCRGFQYEVGKEYELPEGQSVELCECGFHACENPFDVLDYYQGLECRYCEVEQAGAIKSDGKKTASSKIKIKADIGFVGLFKAGIEYLKEITKYNDNDCNGSGDSAQIGSSGDSAQIGSSGDSAQIGSSGDYAKIGSSGDSAKIGSSGNSAKIGSSGNSARIGSSGNYAQIKSDGKDAVIMCAGERSKARAKVGSWITLAEWIDGKPVCVKTEQVDGVRIKADTWYTLKNGEFVECEID